MYNFLSVKEKARLLRIINELERIGSRTRDPRSSRVDPRWFIKDDVGRMYSCNIATYAGHGIRSRVILLWNEHKLDYILNRYESYAISFEEVLNRINPEQQADLLFHLDLFT